MRWFVVSKGEQLIAPGDWLAGRPTRSLALLAVLLVLAVSRPSAAQTATPSRAAVDSQAPVASLSTLSPRIRPGDRLSVRVTSGEEIEGTFSSVSASSLTMVVDGQSREIPATDVQQVWRRGANRVRKGMLVGFVTGAAVTSLIFVAGFGPEAILPSVVVGGGTGLMWGALIGAFVHERPLVYRAAAPTVRVIPMLTPDRIGVMASVHFERHGPVLDRRRVRAHPHAACCRCNGNWPRSNSSMTCPLI